MKLSNLYIKNAVCGSSIILESDTPLSYQIIEAAVETGIIGEEDLGILAQFLKAGLSKIQAALSPNSPDDLEMLLSFVAPHSGGSRTINKLVDTAKNQESSVLDDTVWLNELFKAFGAEKAVQDQVLNQLKREHNYGQSLGQNLNKIGKPTPKNPKSNIGRAKPTTAQPQQPQPTPQPTSPQSGQPEEPGELETLVQKFRSNKENALENMKRIEAQLSALRAQHSAVGNE